MGLSRKKHVEHRAAVYDTRPLPDDPKPFEPYFVAICECDWLGGFHATSDEAFADAYRHTPNVDGDVKRPLG